MSTLTSPSAEEKLSRLRAVCRSLKEQMGTVLIGQQEVVHLLITGILSGGHMIVIGV